MHPINIPKCNTVRLFLKIISFRAIDEFTIFDIQCTDKYTIALWSFNAAWQYTCSTAHQLAAGDNLPLQMSTYTLWLHRNESEHLLGFYWHFKANIPKIFGVSGKWRRFSSRKCEEFSIIYTFTWKWNQLDGNANAPFSISCVLNEPIEFATCHNCNE